MLNLNLKEIPQAPGVYLFKSKRGEVLYVGKAKDLRARLSTYVREPYLSPKLEHLLRNTESVEYFLTDTEKAALLLEANLIKKYRPKYNVLLKDDKNYPLLRIPIKEKYPSLQIVRKRKKGDQALYFGPFTSARGLREILKLLSKTFPLRKCSLAEMKRRKTPCIYYQIKKCLAPCVNPISEEEYKKMVDGVIEFFQGKGKELIKKLEEEMHHLAENLEFERAAFLRDRIEDLKKVLETQAVVLDTPLDLDLWEYKKENSNEYFIVLFVRYGYLYGFQTFQIKNPLGEKPALKEVILQFYMEGKIIPEKIFLPEKPEEKEELESILSELSGKEIKILESFQDEKIKILRDLALKNLENFILSEKRREKPWYAGLSEELVEVLRLSREPRWIEAIDLSQFYGTARVGALVCFFEGEPEKSRYRHYHIKGEGKDDYAMLYEVVYRRLKRGLEENNLPDLILIDGGKGHLETALRAGEDLEVKEVEFRAIAKNEKRQPEKLYIPGRKNPLFLPKYKEVYHFIGRVMSEAHRFAKTFAEKTKEKETLTSILDRIKGIGPKRKEVLLENFKDLEEILNAPLEKLSNLPGFNLKIAKTLKRELQKQIQT
ncbi:UvrABC system protein C [Thermodesulfobacterium geofontis OPF15]|uniref:UvrABC system protein C n=1 Tax=Thermodesulfobacterium geofontis (strain OPF15) TaxID=795359 RepID=F8C5M4_THEGP|nr:excinuclease ABC subunit UvrC [Thermodesulfobacterium geofontis]AEH23004.1 UvrABC system protein C [Thermodesulfobacterium geofontis OPF15]